MSSDSNPTPKVETDDVIDKLLAEAMKAEPGSEKFTTLVDQLEKLHKIKSIEKDNRSSKFESLLPVFGNLAGILAILNFERSHVVTSKALSFVMKSR